MNRCSVFRPLPLALAIALSFGTVTATAQAPSAEALLSTPVQLHIVAQPLGQALNDWARQCRIELIVPPALVAGKTAPAVSGPLAPRQALDRLLAGSGLVASLEGVAMVIKAAPASTGASLPTIMVTASADQPSATGPLRGIVATRSATGTKTSTPILETPQSISVVGAEEIESIKAQSLMDALGYVAGVTRVEGVDRTTESLVIRGFEAWADNGSLYRDGTKYAVNNNNGTQEPYGLERIELLKGAASVLYGAAAPGGIINTVSKRPSATPLHELNAEVGSFDRKQVSGDFGGALGADADNPGDWSYRLTFLARRSGTFVDHVPDDRNYLAPALRWQPSASTSLTLLSEYQHDRTAYVYGLPAQGTVQANVNGRIPRSRFVGEPGFDRYDNTRWSVGYLFEHAFNEQLKLRNSLRHYQQSNARPFVYIDGLTPDQRSTDFRAAVEAVDHSNAITSDTSLEYRWRLGATTHTSLVGVDHTYQKHAQVTRTGNAGPLDLYAPVYGGPVGPFGDEGIRRLRDRKTGLYAQDQMKVNERWVVLLGGRQDWSRNDAKAASSGAWSNEQTDAFSGRAGLVYLTSVGLAPFLSYSQSFEPTAGGDRLGQRFKPSEGDQVEAGLRFQPANSPTLLSAVVYQLTKTNVSVTDPVDVNFSVQQGKVRSRGFEFEARTRLARRVNLIGAYAYTDAHTLQSSALTPELNGTRTGGVPRHQLSLWSDLDFGGLGLPGFKAGAGVRHVGSTIGSYVAVDVPAFTLVDAMVSYGTGPWRFALNATNLAERYHVSSCTYACFYGEPRKLIGTLSYRW